MTRATLKKSLRVLFSELDYHPVQGACNGGFERSLGSDFMGTVWFELTRSGVVVIDGSIDHLRFRELHSVAFPDLKQPEYGIYSRGLILGKLREGVDSAFDVDFSLSADYAPLIEKIRTFIIGEMNAWQQEQANLEVIMSKVLVKEDPLVVPIMFLVAGRSKQDIQDWVSNNVSPSYYGYADYCESIQRLLKYESKI